ncbi:MAG TPA: hydrogenase maturation peptidase HycI [Firmicutes bacterium]|jgi:hydrogenase 3 maturation protease|nr:hydrogenase maturation peptidase HycI [Bacillota bacterium]
MKVVNEFLNLLQGGNKIAFLGVGAPLRADDSIGLYIVSELEKKLKKDSKREYLFCLGELAPENFSGMIRRWSPSHVVIVDAAEIEGEPGSFSLIPSDKIEGASFSTHILPLKILVDYFKQTIGCQIIIVGVRPKLLEFAYPVTDKVKNAADQFICEICEKL